MTRGVVIGSARSSRALGLAAIAGGVVVGVAIALRVLDPAGLPAPSVSALVPILWGMAAVVVLALTRSWAPTLGWAAAIVGATAGALSIIGFTAEIRQVTTGLDPRLEAISATAVLLPPVIAATYATAGRRRTGVIAACWLVVGTLAVLVVARAMARAQGTDLAGVLPNGLWLGLIGVLAAAGLARDLAPALARTRDRMAAGDAPSGSGSSLPALRVFVDELVPGRDASRVEAIESERGRIAADLHAEVLPSLRRALVAAEDGGTVERLAADLRTAVDEVESLLVARRSIVLEEMGLLAGVEWLAERVEDRSEVRVDIEVDGGSEGGRRGGNGGHDKDERDGDDHARLPRDVERAAFRIAQLALDNVVRHAPGSHARVVIAIASDRVALRVEDDGDGPAVDEAAAARGGRRGIADMRAEARGCGGVLEVGPVPGHGTLVAFRWPG